MRIKIRKCLFETNSSSQHSIVVLKNSKKNTIEEIINNFSEDGKIVLSSDDCVEYERSPFHIICTFTEKLLYLYGSEGIDKDFLKQYVNKMFSNKIEIVYPTVCFSDNCLCGEDNSISDAMSRSLNTSTYNKKRCWGIPKNVTIEDFLLDDRYIVVVDGDEYVVFDKILDSGIIDKEHIESRFFI